MSVIFQAATLRLTQRKEPRPTSADYGMEAHDGAASDQERETES